MHSVVSPYFVCLYILLRQIRMASKADVDQGWAWLVLIAVYSGILILSTSMFTAGVMFVALLDYYHEDVAKTSIIGSLNSGLLCLMGEV